MQEILLIGTNHYYTPQQRLERILTEFRPKHILIEGSQAEHERNVSTIEEWQRLTAKEIGEIREIISHDIGAACKEVLCAQGYASREGISWSFLEEDRKDSPYDMAILPDLVKKLRASPVRKIQRQTRERKEQIRLHSEHWCREWGRVSENGTESELAKEIRDDFSDIDMRDEKMWATFKRYSEAQPNARLATITGAAHVMRTNSGTSFLDRIEASKRFTIKREILLS